MTNLVQSLMFAGGFPDSSNPAARGCTDSTAPCFVYWAGGISNVQSVMLYLQAISFSVQFMLFTTFGSLADYGRWNRYVMIVATVISVACQILPITLVNDDGTHWAAMYALDTIGLIAYGTTLVFYGAAFPNLSDNLPVVRKARADPSMTKSEKMAVVERWRNHVSAISTTHSNIGFLVLTGVLSGVGYYNWSGRYNFDEGTQAILGNAPVFGFMATVVCGGYMVLCSLPYFIAQPRGRGGPPLPPNENYFTVGWKSIIRALREARKFRFLFLYIFSYFLFADAVTTTNVMIGIIQGNVTEFNNLQLTILNLASAASSIVGCLMFLVLSKKFGVRTKLNLFIIVTLSMVVAIWGCIGISSDKFGFKNVWELWAFYVWSGLFTAPIWAWQQTMLAELVPRGMENLFFGLFGVVNKGSAWVGPVIIGAITDKLNNVYVGWVVVLAFFVVSLIILFFVDVNGAKIDIERHYRAQMEIDAQNEEQNAPVSVEKILQEDSASSTGEHA
ncbi:autophagy-related protein 22-like protein [Gongronella butleri]|nr:autophagy-related protein 22-like protein [Gongronella butleri]